MPVNFSRGHRKFQIKDFSKLKKSLELTCSKKSLELTCSNELIRTCESFICQLYEKDLKNNDINTLRY